MAGRSPSFAFCLVLTMQARSNCGSRDRMLLTNIFAAKCVNQSGEILIVTECGELTGGLIAFVGHTLVNASE